MCIFFGRLDIFITLEITINYRAKAFIPAYNNWFVKKVVIYKSEDMMNGQV